VEKQSLPPDVTVPSVAVTNPGVQILSPDVDEITLIPKD
jgi:hypothetical protein